MQIWNGFLPPIARPISWDADCVEAEIDASATDQATSLLDLRLRRRAFSAEMQHFLPGASMAS